MDPLLVGGEAREGTEGRLKRTLSDIFLARKSSTNKDGGQLGHSLISAVTTSFLGCIAPLATEFERCACTCNMACTCTRCAWCVHAVHMPSSSHVRVLRPTTFAPFAHRAPITCQPAPHRRTPASRPPVWHHSSPQPGGARSAAEAQAQCPPQRAGAWGRVGGRGGVVGSWGALVRVKFRLLP